MFYLADIFQLIVNGFNDRPFSEHYPVPDRHQTVLHVPFQSSYQVYPLNKQLFKELLRDITFVGKDFPEYFVKKVPVFQRLSVINIPRRDHKIQYLAFFVYNQMQLEPKEIAHCRFPPLGDTIEYFMPENPFVVAHPQRGRIDKRYPRT